MTETSNTLTSTEITERRDKYLKTVDIIYEKWKDDPLLQGFPENQAKKVAVILDNEKLMMEASNFREPFAKIVLEVTAKVFRDFLGFNLVSIQPMLGPTGDIYYNDFTPLHEIKLSLTYREASAKTKRMKSRLFTEDYNKEGFIDQLAKDLREEITREILTDLRNNVCTIATIAPIAVDKIDEYDLDAGKICVKLREVNEVICKKTGYNIQWLVTSPEIGKILGEQLHCNWKQKVNTIEKVGMLGKWTLIIDPLFPRNQILCGAYEELLGGYFYCPYVFLTECGPISDPEILTGDKYGFLTRYCKYLIKGKPYCRVNCEISSEKTEAKTLSSASDSRKHEEKVEKVKA